MLFALSNTKAHLPCSSCAPQLTQLVHARARRRFKKGLSRKYNGLVAKILKSKKNVAEFVSSS